jgi:hypothetical protein
MSAASSSAVHANIRSRMAARIPGTGDAHRHRLGLTPVEGLESIGRDGEILLLSLWCRATAEIAAKSGVPPRLKASASMASSGRVH